MHPALERTDHRPWPLPESPWVMAMSWHDLAFLHWPVSAAALAKKIPPGLTLDTFEGDAYLGVVPFHMTGVRPRLGPSIPGVSSFIELNVRTYVTTEGKPGVWFFSLDATSRLAVRAARRFFHLPYFDARMSSVRGGMASSTIGRSGLMTAPRKAASPRVPRHWTGAAIRPREVAHREILPLLGEGRPRLPRRHPSSALAARRGGGRD